MGCCVSSASKTEKKLKEGEYELLLLGISGSGKSTIFKTLRQIEGEEVIDPRMVVQATWVIRKALLEFMTRLIIKSQSLYEQDKEKNANCLLDTTTETNAHRQCVMNISESSFGENVEQSEEDLTALGNALAYLWKLSSIQETFAKRVQFENEPNIEYLFERATDIMHPKYFAINEDILKSRIRTTGTKKKKAV
ncbi:hypothetical protein RFI_21186 [Reticulomyxa filosa]|uniref:Uncharacterized protein n=1 Tax=Reticulomyxa filosa TaxID=46433 RepID=X6MQ95_RETFI|nr:hypothetical protein RFI_21186 [Reticulomyxa filosa]|eukprot:ETO16173.1 hypothetical protein RFI_21186 [Reticulomyxa filosa]